MSDLLTQESKVYETNPNTIPQAIDNPLSQDSISDLFNTRDQVRDNARDRAPGPVPDQKLSLNRDQKNPTKLSHSQEQTQSPQADPNRAALSKQEETKKSSTESKQAEGSKQEEPPLEVERLQEELSKTQKRLLENQQYGRQNAQRLKTALKVVKELEAEGSLSEEEAGKLRGTLDGDTEEALSADASHPFGKVMAIANQELENIRKYTDDDLLDDKVGAFDYFLLVASKEEREQALEDLTELIHTPLPLAKKMLSIGHGYEQSYREMKAAGSLYGLLTKKDQEASDLRKNLDKLTKKLAQYEDYDKPRYRLEEMGESMGQDPSGDTITSLFEDRDRIKKR